MKNNERYFGVIFVIFCTKAAVITSLFKIKCDFALSWENEVCLGNRSDYYQVYNRPDYYYDQIYVG